MTELGALAEQIGVSERTLRRAFNQGTLRAERPTPRKLTLGSNEKRYLRRSWKLLAGLREALRTEQNVRFALLFGSAARGDDDEGSDVDLIVEMRDPSPVRIVDLELKLERLLGRRVDVLTLKDAGANPVLMAEAVTDGRTIIDREERWIRLSAEAEAMESRAQRHLRDRSRSALAGISRLFTEA
ncbi:MAG TPA: nucleotidyltransferase domain-containing protein [Solirubrobacterales bacterium]|nr:nucleotidyltransferase domain-containing protein [Solirubrobacterales bacterium]